MSIDSSARIDPTAEIDSDVTIGPWTIVGPNVQIGSGTVIDSHVVIRANTKMGKNNRIFQFSSVGEDPADLKFEGEETWLEIGDNNVLREGSNFHRGTGFGGGLTRVGSDNLFMPYVHIAHDCMVGNNTIFSNNVGISGHVEVGDWVILGGYAGVNQYLKIGAHAFVGGVTHIDHDVPAYMIVAGQPARVRAVNTIGLERRGFDKDTIKRLRTAYKIVFMRGLGLTEAVEELKVMPERCDAVQLLIDSLESSKKGIHR